MKGNNIIVELEKWIKPELIDTWDNTGFQIGDNNIEVKKILLALDLDREVLDYAIDNNIDMIITHHPVIFRPIESITNTSYKGRLIMDAIKNNILIYNAHSNLDLVDKGVNDQFAKLLEMRNVEKLSDTVKVDQMDYGYGRIGEIEEINILDFLEKVKSKLKADHLIVYGDLNNKVVSRIAVCGGSGAGFIDDAILNNAQVYVTGDIKYHDAQLAYENDLILIDASHYDTEKIILPIIKEYLIEKFADNLDIEILSESMLPKIIY